MSTSTLPEQLTQLKHNRSLTPCQLCATPLTHSITAKLVRCPVCKHTNPVTAFASNNNISTYPSLDALQVRTWSVDQLKFYLVGTGTVDSEALKFLTDYRIGGDQFLKLTEKDITQWDLSPKSTKTLLEHSYNLGKTATAAPYPIHVVSQTRLDMKAKELKAHDAKLARLEEGKLKYAEQQDLFDDGDVTPQTTSQVTTPQHQKQPAYHPPQNIQTLPTIQSIQSIQSIQAQQPHQPQQPQQQPTTSLPNATNMPFYQQQQQPQPPQQMYPQQPPQPQMYQQPPSNLNPSRPQ